MQECVVYFDQSMLVQGLKQHLGTLCGTDQSKVRGHPAIAIIKSLRARNYYVTASGVVELQERNKHNVRFGCVLF